MSNTQQPEALNLEEFRAKVTHAAREPLLARIAELEAQLSAIGAGGVEPLRKVAVHGMDGLEDTALLNFLQTESWDLRCFDVPTGGDDSEVHWQVIEHHMAAPHEREVGRAYSDDPREAIRNAIGNATNITAQAKKGGAA